VRAVHKFQLPESDGGHTITLKMPRFAEPLHVAVQGRALCLWALVDTEQPLQNHELEVYGTGHDMAHQHDSVTKPKHLSTVLLDGGSLVLHFFTRESTFEDEAD
jgi:hypothetical protein